MRERNISTFIGCDKEYDASQIVVFGAPFDSTTSFRPGARFGPAAMRGESFGMETYSPYQERDLEDINVFDWGDEELPFGSAERALQQIEDVAAQILEDEKIPVMIGGEHLVSLGAMRAVSKKYPDIQVIHFDAHADLREDYLGVKLSHACVMRRIWEIIGDGKIHQFGIRSGDRQELAWGKGRIETCKFDFNNLDNTLEKLSGAPIYLSIDLDVLDTSVFPGTGTPEAGGVTFNQLLQSIISVCKKGNVVAADIDELAPNLDHSGISTATACKVLRELLLAMS